MREEWMLELPPDRAGEFGLGPRQFRKTTPQERGDTSGWTETPSGKSQPRSAPAEKVRTGAVTEWAGSSGAAVSTFVLRGPRLPYLYLYP